MFWFFKKKSKPLPGSLAEEEWKESFSIFRKSRFRNQSNEKYSCEIIPGTGLVLALKSENLFAWCDPPEIRYTDFTAECEFSFDPGNSYSSAGLIYRMGNDFNYYYFLVSDKGYFRIDCVFNGNPMKLVSWTRLARPLEESNRICVTAWGSSFIFSVNNIQVARLDDETIASGNITFCGQNYGSGEARLILKRFYLDSRPEEVEKAYSESSLIPPEQQLLLARSFFEKGQFIPAAVQMKSLLGSADSEHDTPENHAFYGEILLNLGLNNEALSQFETVLARNSEDINCLLEKGNLLYRMGRYDTLRDFLQERKDMLSGNPLYWNLYGHALFYLGRKEESAVYYSRAAGLDPESPLFACNAARAFEESGSRENAAAMYAEGSVLFFRQEQYDDAENAASLAVSLLSGAAGAPGAGREKDSNIAATLAKAESVLAKILFQKQHLRKAEEKLRFLVSDYPDECGSEIFYLYGLLLAGRGRHVKALSMIRKACEKEDYYLYWYKLAELCRDEGKDPEEPLRKALSLSPDDCWANNLMGEILLERGEEAAASAFFQKAYNSGKEKGEKVPALNHAQTLASGGDYRTAVEVLDSIMPDPEALVLKAGILESAGDTDQAEAVFAKAAELYPDDVRAAGGAAAFFYRNGQYGRAETALAQFDPLPADRLILNIAGNLARIRGSFEAAFDAYEKSLSLCPDPVVALNYAEGLCESLDYEKAAEILDIYFPERKGSLATSSRYGKKIRERLENLAGRIEREIFNVLSCSVCGLEWKVPRKVGKTGAIKLVGEPDPSSPAGKCTVCGRIYCVRCASSWVRNGRFYCPECGENLKLSDNALRYLAAKSASEGVKGGGSHFS